MGATICINPQAIVDDLGVHVSDAILLGLLGHELSHHFGYADKVVNQKGQEIYPLGSALVDVFEEQDNRSDVNDRVTDLSFCQSPAYANAMQSVKYNVEF